MLNAVLSLTPVVLFLAALIVLDSYKLVTFRSVVTTILLGCVLAAGAYAVNTALLNGLGIDVRLFRRYGAPFVEESFKGIYVIYLIRRRKVGFMVDAAIAGFAAGTGFALVENVVYLVVNPDPNPLYWLIRGLGTAIMHGGATAIFAVVTKNLSDRHASVTFGDTVVGMAIAMGIHSLYNHFFLDAVYSTVVVLVLVPAILTAVFRVSEQATRRWLSLGLDTDLEILDMITAGTVSRSPIGAYLQNLKTRMQDEKIADMICLLRIHTELSIRAKGLLLMRKEGYRVKTGDDIKEKFAELQYLEKSIGPTGRLAIAPILRTSSRDLWQIHMLQQS